MTLAQVHIGLAQYSLWIAQGAHLIASPIALVAAAKTAGSSSTASTCTYSNNFLCCSLEQNYIDIGCNEMVQDEATCMPGK